jgi:hypothetical protein
MVLNLKNKKVAILLTKEGIDQISRRSLGWLY